MMANEKRLIDANAAWELLRSLGSRDYRREKGTISDAMKMLSHPAYTPTVDAVEVVHGRWHENDGLTTCSHCGALFDINLRMLKVPSTWEMPNYCPNCGAKMDGGDEDG
jgi:hypothetical protein